jgi:hypothetical protein
MMERKMPPPFKPTIVDGATDVTNIDEEFKNEMPKDTPCAATSMLQAKVTPFPCFEGVLLDAHHHPSLRT